MSDALNGVNPAFAKAGRHRSTRLLASALSMLARSLARSSNPPQKSAQTSRPSFPPLVFLSRTSKKCWNRRVAIPARELRSYVYSGRRVEPKPHFFMRLRRPARAARATRCDDDDDDRIATRLRSSLRGRSCLCLCLCFFPKHQTPNTKQLCSLLQPTTICFFCDVDGTVYSIDLRFTRLLYTRKVTVLPPAVARTRAARALTSVLRCPRHIMHAARTCHGPPYGRL